LKKKIKKKNKKIGILGGTFDPPHYGHLYISKIAIQKFKLNKMIWAITTKNPLKKRPHLKLKKRIQLSKKIIIAEKKISIAFFDKKIKSKNTFDLLRYIKKINMKTNLYFLIGADNLAKFHKWHNWKKIPKIAKLVVFPREHYLIGKNKYIALKSIKKNDIIYIKSKKVNISSSLIRKFW